MGSKEKCEASIRFIVEKPGEKDDGGFKPGLVRTEVDCQRCQFRSAATARPLNDPDLVLKQLGFAKLDVRIIIRNACKKWREIGGMEKMPEWWFPVD